MGMVGFGLVLTRTSKFIAPIISYCGDALQVWHHDEAIFRSILVLVTSIRLGESPWLLESFDLLII
jgi:hypothetical protein